MTLPGLFMREARQQDNSLTQLPQDMDLWTENIVSLVREKLPHSKACTIKVSFLKKNEELGTATGAAELYNQKLNKSIYIPLIVKNYSLCPLDVMMVPNPNVETKFDVIPLTMDYFKEALFNNDVFDKLDKPFDRLQQLYGYNQGRLAFPPTFRNTYASANIYDSIQGTVWNEDVSEFKKYVRDNPSVLVGYEKRANLDILRKIAKTHVKVAADKTKLKTISLIKKDMGGTYKTFSTSDDAYDPVVNQVAQAEIRRYHKSEEAAEDTLHEVERNGEHIVMAERNTVDPVVHYPADKTKMTGVSAPTDILAFGAYYVQDKNGVKHSGAVIPNIISYDMKPLKYKIFYGDGKVSFSDKMVGVRRAGGIAKDWFKFREPKEGMTGAFVAQNDKTAMATFPITVRSMLDKCGAFHIIGMDLNGNKVKVKYRKYGGGDVPTGGKIVEEFKMKEDLQKIVKVKDFYIVPGCFKFLPLENFIDLTDSKTSVLQKAAAAHLDAAPISVVHTGKSQFALKGPDMIKMASKVGWNTNNLTPQQTAFLLASKGSSSTKIAQAMKMAGERGVAEIHGLPATVYGEDVQSYQVKVASVWLDAVRQCRVNLVKEASHFEDAQMVDSALSLNFVNPDNIDKFVGFIPTYEQVIKMLAQTLLAGRLGMTEIPEQSTSTAMMKMVDVVKGLKRLAVHTKEDDA